MMDNQENESKKPPRILIVEDEVIVAAEIRTRLTGMGYEVCGVISSGEEALEKVAETRPHLILMDIKLKGDMDGVETAQRVHEQFNIPVVYVTAYADNRTLKRAKITEPFGYVLKPFQERDLRIALEIALYKDKVEKERKQLIQQLRDALNNIKTLRGLLPICSSCKKIRDDKGYWHMVEEYIHAHSEADFTHSFCPDCIKKLYPDLDNSGE